MKTHSGGESGVRFGQLPALWRSACWFLGARWRWLLVLPVLAAAATLTELVTLLALVRALLLLSASSTDAHLNLLFTDVEVTFRFLIAAAAIGALGSMAIRSVESVVVGRLTALATANARERSFRAYFHADWQEVANRRGGELQQLLGHNAQLVSEVIPTLGTVLASMLSLFVYGLVVLIAAPLVGLLFLVLGGGASLVFSAARRGVYSSAQRSADSAREVQLSAATLTTLNRELHLFGVTDSAVHDLEKLNRASRRELRGLRTTQRLLPAIFIQTVLLLVVVVLYAAEVWGIDGATFGAAAILAVRSLAYLQQLNSSLQLAAEIRPYAEEIHTFVDEYEGARRVDGGLALGALESIELIDVSFAYADGDASLSDISLTLHAGEWIGIVGPSGGGKTTLVNLLAGLLRPATGAHLVNGRAARTYSADSWKGRVALLSQEPALIRGTVAENIAFYRPVGPEAVRAAAERAAVRVEIDHLPEGFETRVGDGESGLSGGQRQRIALARVLVGNPDLLILDEPTSALDAAKEHEIEVELSRLPEDPIVVVASHRPALLRRCHRFVVIEHGRIVEIHDDYERIRDRARIDPSVAHGD